MIYESLDNALFEKDEKFKKTRLKNPDHNIEKYNLYGFTSEVQAWIYEAIGGLPSTWVVKTKNKIPRILQWKPMASSRITFVEVYSFFNNEFRLGDVLQTLEPNSKESSRKYWLSVKDYLSSIPDWVHKHQLSINAMPSAPDDYGVYTDVGNENLSTPTLLYSFYVDVSGRSVQVFPEVPPGVSKFGRAYIPSYVYNSPYMIPPVKRGQNARPLPRPQIMEHAIDMSTSVDVNPLRGLEDSSLFAEFDRWFTGDSRVRRRIPHPRSFFQIILGIALMGWLGDEVFLNQLWNNRDCAVDSLVFDDRLNSYLCGRQHTMSKSMTDVDMLLIPVNLDGAHWVLARVDFWKNKVWIYDSLLTFRDNKRYKLKFKSLEVIFPRWLEYVGFYNIRPELRSADPWKVVAVKSAPQQEPRTGDCGFI
ncbi:hypothetical protein CUMW_190820 [Citrus unshiu]|nr:hypothetical protein CUMW_190820 [Citrus unshiu]